MKVSQFGLVLVLLVVSPIHSWSASRTSRANEPVDNLQGTIVQIDSSSISLQDRQSKSHRYKIAETTACIIDGREAPPARLSVGLNCLLSSIDGRLANSITAFNAKGNE